LTTRQDLETLILAWLPQPAFDFLVRDEGSIFVFTPCTDAAHAWVEEHITEDAPRWGRGIVVEHRYISGVVNMARRDGLSVKVQP
jgi:hypothetical protein